MPDHPTAPTDVSEETTWFDRIADKVMDSLAKKWRGKLAGFDSKNMEVLATTLTELQTVLIKA